MNYAGARSGSPPPGSRRHRASGASAVRHHRPARLARDRRRGHRAARFALICVISVRAFSSSPAAWSAERTDAKQPEQEVHVVRGDGGRASRATHLALSAGLARRQPVGLHFLGDGPIVVSRVPGWWLWGLFTIAIAVPLHFIFRRHPGRFTSKRCRSSSACSSCSLRLLVVRLAAIRYRNGDQAPPGDSPGLQPRERAVGTLGGFGVFRRLSRVAARRARAQLASRVCGIFVDELYPPFSLLRRLPEQTRVGSSDRASRPVALSLGVDVINTFLALVTAARSVRPRNGVGDHRLRRSVYCGRSAPTTGWPTATLPSTSSTRSHANSVRWRPSRRLGAGAVATTPDHPRRVARARDAWRRS